GSKTRTMASQNVIRSKNHICSALFPSDKAISIVNVSARISEVFSRRSNHRLGINQRNPYVGIGLRLALDESVAGLCPEQDVLFLIIQHIIALISGHC